MLSIVYKSLSYLQPFLTLLLKTPSIQLATNCPNVIIKLLKVTNFPLMSAGDISAI